MGCSKRPARVRVARADAHARVLRGRTDTPRHLRTAPPPTRRSFWSLIAVVIWTGFDNVFAFLWATGRLPYLSDAAAFASPRGVAQFVAALLLVPAWRDAHFYAAHRLLHAPAMYRQVHSLHHRNTDIEPFAGLCMHPVEHL